jgi:hypothetical protein
MQFSDRYAAWKVANGSENIVLQALQFQQMAICCKFPDIVDLMSAL